MSKNTIDVRSENIKQVRSFIVECGEIRAAEDGQNEYIDISFSSEQPYEREDGIEILSHALGALDLSYSKDGLPFCVDHDSTHALSQIGLVESVRIERQKGRGEVRFSPFNPLAKIVFGDMTVGIRKNVSVGYCVLERTPVRPDGTYLVTKWMPYEVSSVIVPADITVGVNRAAELGATEQATEQATQQTTDPSETTETAEAENNQVPDAVAGSTEVPADEEGQGQPEETPPVVEPVSDENSQRDLNITVWKDGAVVAVSITGESEESLDDETTVDINNENDITNKLEQNCDTTNEQVRSLDGKNKTWIKDVVEWSRQHDIESRALELTKDIKYSESEVRTLLLKELETKSKNAITESKTYIKGNNKMSEVKEMLADGLTAAFRGNFDGIPAEVRGMFTQVGERSFKVGLFNRAGEMTATGSGAPSVYTHNIGTIEMLRKRCALLALGASTKYAQGYASYVRQNAAITATLRGENPTAITNTAPGMEVISYTPKSLSAKVPFTEELKTASVIDIMSFIENDIMKVFAERLDFYGIQGAVTPAVAGLLSAGSTIQNGDLGAAGMPVFKDVNNLKVLVDAYNTDLETCGYLVTPGLLGYFETTQKGTGVGMICENNKLNGYKVKSSGNVPIATLNHSCIFGDFSALEFCFMGDIQFDINTSNQFAEGITMISARQMFDIGIKQPNAFAKSANYKIA